MQPLPPWFKALFEKPDTLLESFKKAVSDSTRQPANRENDLLTIFGRTNRLQIETHLGSQLKQRYQQWLDQQNIRIGDILKIVLASISQKKSLESKELNAFYQLSAWSSETIEERPYLGKTL